MYAQASVHRMLILHGTRPPSYSPDAGLTPACTIASRLNVARRYARRSLSSLQIYIRPRLFDFMLRCEARRNDGYAQCRTYAVGFVDGGAALCRAAHVSLTSCRQRVGAAMTSIAPGWLPSVASVSKGALEFLFTLACTQTVRQSLHAASQRLGMAFAQLQGFPSEALRAARTAGMRLHTRSEEWTQHLWGGFAMVAETQAGGDVSSQPTVKRTYELHTTRSSVGLIVSRAALCVLAFGFGILFVSELCLLFQFQSKFSWNPPTPPHDAPSGFSPTPISVILSKGGRPQDANEVWLFALGVALLLSCGWSLRRLEMGVFWYRMARPYATDTSSLAFNSAIFCRIAVMLVYNTDILVLPAESDGLRTTQTRFYCTFVRKTRLIVPSHNGHDYYLLIVPTLLLILCIFLYFDCLSRVRHTLASIFTGRSQVAVFRFGRTAIPWHEDKGRELLVELLEATRHSAAIRIQRNARRWLRQSLFGGRRRLLEEFVAKPARSGPPALKHRHHSFSGTLPRDVTHVPREANGIREGWMRELV